MAQIDSLGTNFYYSGVQNASRENIRKNDKTENSKSIKKSRFADLINKKEDFESEFVMTGLPEEIRSMPFDDAIIFLKDAVDLSGDELSANITDENIQKFKQAVSNFVRFVVMNNYEVSSKRRKLRNGSDLMEPSKTNFFSNYSLPPHKATPKYKIEVINKKVEELTRFTLQSQMNNLKILSQINEIKGLIVDLMSS